MRVAVGRKLLGEFANCKDIAKQEAVGWFWLLYLSQTMGLKGFFFGTIPDHTLTSEHDEASQPIVV